MAKEETDGEDEEEPFAQHSNSSSNANVVAYTNPMLPEQCESYLLLKGEGGGF